MATIRTLVTKLVLDSRQAFKDLKAYDLAWKAVAKSVETSARAAENAAARAMGALQRASAVAGTIRSAAASAGAARGSGGGGARRGGDPLDAVMREARAQERQQRAAERAAEAQRRSIERTENRKAQTGARQAGLAAGAAPVNDATAALGRFATASDKAKAKVADLSAQVERNRKEMADLAVQIAKTGDADGALAARKQGLAVATGKASVALGDARRELRAVDGGLIDAVKSAANLSGKFDVLKVAAGNLLSGAVSRAVDAVKSGIVGAAGAAMDFEKALVDVAKVAKDADLTKDGLLDPRVKQGIKDVAKDLGVMPTEVAELTAQITAAFSGKTDIVALASDVTKIGVAWDISGKQAGEFFKQTSAGLQLSADETKLLFGSINQLGNELGIKSSEIAEAMTRSAGVLKGANLSGETGAALNATLIKAGASAEVAATGVRTFVARLGAGEAATDKQIHAFQALGLSAEAVAKNLSSGDAARAEAQIKEVVAALVKMGETSPDQRMATLIELFGSESIGSIGAAATAVETLATSFGIAGNKAAALTSVQLEYDRVSNTSASRVEKLKANIGVLAIEMGEKLLPYVDRLVNFLTSPEGQEWGARAAETAAKVVTGLAEVVGALASGFLVVTDALGGTTMAVGLLAIAVSALLGPWSLLLTGAVALGTYLGGPFIEQMDAARASELLLAKSIVDGGKAIQELTADVQRTDGVFAKLSDRWREIMLRILGATDALNEFHRRSDAEEVRAGKLKHEEARAREVERQRTEQAKRTQAAGMADADRRREAAGGGSTGDEAGMVASDFINAKGRVDLSGFDAVAKDRIFERLAARRAAGKPLKPSEAKLLTALSKDLDRPIPKSHGGGHGHKATKMDKQLASLDPSLAGVLTAGGDTDKGGDLKVHDDVLSKGAFRSALAGKGGLGGLSSSGVGLGPGPNIHTEIFNFNFNVAQQIDARSNAPAAENIASSATVAAQNMSRYVFTGGEKVLARRNAGGRMV